MSNTPVANRNVITEIAVLRDAACSCIRAEYRGVLRNEIKPGGIQNRIPKTKAINLTLLGGVPLNPHLADARAMWPLPRRNATLVPGMRCNDRNHLRFSYGGMFLDAVCTRWRPRGGISRRK